MDLICMGDRDWLASRVAWAVFVRRVTVHCHGLAGCCFPPLGRLVRSRGLGLGLLRGARSGAGDAAHTVTPVAGGGCGGV